MGFHNVQFGSVAGFCRGKSRTEAPLLVHVRRLRLRSYVQLWGTAGQPKPSVFVNMGYHASGGQEYVWLCTNYSKFVQAEWRFHIIATRETRGERT